jgi:hypothetical protein
MKYSCFSSLTIKIHYETPDQPSFTLLDDIQVVLSPFLIVPSARDDGLLLPVFRTAYANLNVLSTEASQDERL